MKIHTVKAGEGPGSIALRYSVSEKALRLANQLSAPGPLVPGQSLFIPEELPRSCRTAELAAIAGVPVEPACANALTYLAHYCHRFDASGALIPPDFGCDSEALRFFGCAPLLCLANLGEDGGFSPELAHLLFCHEHMRARLSESLVSALKAGRYYGLQLCFHYLFPFERDNYSAFVSELSDALHREGFMLSLELAPPDSPALSAAMDYEALGRCCERLSLMFCRWAHSFSPPQPLAPTGYIRAALDMLSPLVPGEKMLLGISGCGYDWRLPWRQGDSAARLSNAHAAELAMSLGTAIRFDARAEAPFFDYSDALSRRHRVYFEDARSIAAKLDIAEEYGLAGIALYSWESGLRAGDGVPERLYSAEKLL